MNLIGGRLNRAVPSFATSTNYSVLRKHKTRRFTMQGRKPVLEPLGDVVDLPSSAVRIPKASKHLRGLEREVWDETVREMVAKNIYDSDVKAAVEAFCIQRARFIEACEKVHETGQLGKTQRGAVRYNPWVGISNVAFLNMIRLAAELGLTPVSRQRAAKVKGTRSIIPAAKFLKRNVS